MSEYAEGLLVAVTHTAFAPLGAACSALHCSCHPGQFFPLHFVLRAIISLFPLKTFVVQLLWQLVVVMWEGKRRELELRAYKLLKF